MDDRNLFSKPVEPPVDPDKDKDLVFVLIRVGVYRHEIGGVFTTMPAASSAAYSLFEKEPDAYHAYEIQPVKLNMIAELVDNGKWESGRLMELESSTIINPKPHNEMGAYKE